MVVVQRGDNFLVGREMFRQHVVDVAEQRNIVAADDAGDTPYPFVVLLPNIDKIAQTGYRVGFLQIAQAVIPFGHLLVPSFPNHNLMFLIG